MSKSGSTWESRFSAEALARSIRFDPSRGLRGEGVSALLQKVVSAAPSSEGPSPLQKGAAVFEASANALLANLMVAARNRLDHCRFVAISFQRAEYAGTDLSSKAMAALRDHLFAEGYIEGQMGCRSLTQSGALNGHARRTRIRATAKLLDAFARFGVGREHVFWRRQRDLIVMRFPHEGIGPEPPEVSESRQILKSAIARIGASQLTLPEKAWARVISRYQIELTADDHRGEERLLAGDLTAISLYRSFKGDWDLGGRLYGGWWINLPKIERLNLRIEGDPVVELDYARLHPTLLFARAGLELTYDPYELPGVVGPHVRALGKRTFNRLINKTALSVQQKRLALFPFAPDRAALPQGLAFSNYLQRFIERLAPIAVWFGTGEGMRLQREDSDLALDVLKTLAAQRITVLPVHDSFIVRQIHEGALRQAMIDAFRRRYGFKPNIRPEDGAAPAATC